MAGMSFVDGADHCDDAIVRLERITVLPHSAPQWRESVGLGLSQLRDALAATAPHRDTAAARCYAELCRDAPRLVCVLRRLDSERDRLISEAERLSDLAVVYPSLLHPLVAQLLTDVRAHHGHIAELLYQAYTVDIGGEM
jgi:hypothetical protein